MLLNTYILRTKRLNQGFKKEKKDSYYLSKSVFSEGINVSCV